MTKNMAPTTFASERASLLDISLSTGWRDKSTEKIDELKATFKAGEYGQTILANPSLLYESGQKKQAVGGGFVINNGLSTICALVSLQQELTRELAVPGVNTDDVKASWPANLQRIFDIGVMVDFVEFPDAADDDLRFAWNAMLHDVDSNKYTVTSIHNKIEVVLRYVKRVPGGDYQQVMKELLKVYGTSKKTTVWRWVNGAQSIAVSVLKTLDLKPSLPQHYAFDNKYVVGGQGDAAKLKLPESFASKAFLLLFDKLEGNTSVSAKDFQGEYCEPMRRLSAWESYVTRTYGSSASSFPAFSRVVELLSNESGRMKILECVRRKVPLHGAQGVQGIPECQMIVAELEKLKHMKSAGATSSDQAAQSPSATSDKAPVDPMGASPDADDDMILMMDADDAPADPVAKKSRELAFEEMSKITVDTSLEDFKASVSNRVLPNRRTLVLIDAPTSKVRAVLDLINHLAELIRANKFMQSVSVLVTVNSRLDLLSAVEMNMRSKLPGRVVRVIQISHGASQTDTCLPAYAVYSPCAKSDSMPSLVVPCSVTVKSMQAMSYENLRLRCRDPNCSMRDSDNADPCDPLSEIAEDDREEDSLQEQFEEANEAESEATSVSVPLPASWAPNAAMVDLFTFSRPISYYTSLFKDLLQLPSASLMIVLSRTAHPGAMIAARLQGLDVIGGLFGVKAHSAKHGKQLMEEILQNTVKQKASELVGPTVKRLSREHLTFIVTKANPDEQSVGVKDVTPSDSSEWRRGCNSFVPDLAAKTPMLISSEMDRFPVQIVSQEFGLGLISTKSLKEGEIVCNVSALWYDTKAKVEAFLSSEGNRALADRLLRIDEVKLAAESDTADGEIYGVMVGVAGFLQHWSNIRRGGPNLVLKVSTGHGFSDMLVQAVVQTRTGGGIAAKQPLVLNYGIEYDFSLASNYSMSEPEAKRFKGALDKFMHSRQKAGKDDTVCVADDDDVPMSESLPADATGVTVGVDGGLPAPAPGSGPPPPAPGSGPPPPDPTPAPGSGPPPTHAPAPALADNESVLQSDIGGDKFQLVLCSKVPVASLRLKSMVANNSKCSPGSVLMWIREAKIEKGTEGHPYAITKPKQTQVLKLEGSKPPTFSAPKSLHALILETKAVKLAKHGEWPVGQVPVELTAPKNMFFVPTDAKAKEAISVAMTLSQVSCMWILKFDKGQLSPWGVAVVVQKQMIVPGNSSIELQ